MHEAGVESCSGWNRDCHGTVSGGRSHDSPRQPYHRAICSRRSCKLCRSPEGGQVKLRAASLLEREEKAVAKMALGEARNSIRIAKLLRGIEPKGFVAQGDLEIANVAYDSRKISPGALFVAIRGEKTDGNKFVADAAGRGAVAVASEQPRPDAFPAQVVWVEVPDARKALAIIAANYSGRPAEVLKLVGVTGTNGKTTTAYVVDSILRAAGCEVGLLGTVSYRLVRETLPAERTTPESLDLQRILAEVVRAGGTHAVLEASSHALAMDRLWGCPFAVAIFTNLTRDHLDYHESFDEYFAAKRRLFEGTGAGAPSVGVINQDNQYGKRLAGLAARTLTYGLENGADITTSRKL